MSFIFYPYCVPVKGYNRSIVCNLQTGTFDFISNMLYEQIVFGERNDSLPMDQEENNTEGINQLNLNGYGYFEKDNGIDPHHFKKVDLSHHTASHIDNICIIIDDISLHDPGQIKSIVNNLLTRAAQFIFLKEVTEDVVSDLLTNFLDSTLYSIELVLPHKENFDLDNFSKFQRLSSIHFYEASEDSEIEQYEFKCISSKGKLDIHSKCGVRNKLSFGINYEFFTESLHFNNCLHKKMTIDAKGNIKNCPSSTAQFGNIYEENFEIKNVLKNRKFTQNWNVTKDMVKDCKVCEFRYMCMDCRVFTTDDENLSKPINCNYDPYSSTWNNN